jgi:hypothetical protein
VAHLTTQGSANADDAQNQTINNDGVAVTEVAVVTLSGSKPEQTIATQRVVEISTNYGAAPAETGATASGSLTMAQGSTSSTILTAITETSTTSTATISTTTTTSSSTTSTTTPAVINIAISKMHSKQNKIYYSPTV